jgi:uncharacterized membrane protein YccC
MTSMHDRGQRLREAVVPDWLTEAMPEWLIQVVRPRPAPVPWGEMLRAALAICVPLSVGIAVGRRDVGTLPAIGGLLGTMVDTGGPYLTRFKRVLTTAVFGGAAGLILGSFIHGRGWIAVAVLIGVAGVSAVISRLGSTGSATGLQLLVYTSICLGPLGALRPWWHTVLGFVVGVGWALLLIVPGWLLSPRSVEQRSVAAVYHRLASDLRAIGTPRAAAARQAVRDALNTSYDALVTGRSVAGGRSRRMMRLMAALNVSHEMSEAVTTLRVEGNRPPPLVTDTIDHLADAIAAGGPVPDGAHRSGGHWPDMHLAGAHWDGHERRRRQRGAQLWIPPPWSDSPGAVALRDSMAGLARAITWTPSAPPGPTGTSPRDRLRARLIAARDQLRGGWLGQTFMIRLMLCVGVAAAVSEVFRLQRSYWVVLTVAIVLKPDYGSVFARALQRGLGTIVGAVLGAAILAVVPYGPLLLIPLAVLAAGLPYGRARNFGLVATFLTPLVVLLIDLLAPGGWRLAEDRLVDTVIGCAIVLVVGYAPWPMSWHLHLQAKFAETVRDLCRYMEEALVTAWEPADGQPGAPAAAGGVLAPGILPASRSALRRKASRALGDLAAEYQRALSEPTAVSRRTAAWWPAVVGLEEVLDAVTATAVDISRGAPPPSPAAVHQLTAQLDAIATAMEHGVPPPPAGELPDDEALKPIIRAATPVLALLARNRGGNGA